MAKETKNKRAAISRTSKEAALQQKTAEKKTTSIGRRSAGRITSVPLSQIVLDRYQPRPILPVQGGLRDNFFSGKLDWNQTARKWLELAKSDNGLAKQVNELLEMGKSINDLNQIEPATGAWIEDKSGAYRLVLSTGERRFWSLALIAADNNKGEPQLEVQEIEQEELGLARQVVENESSKPLSAIGKARAIAGLVLENLEDLPLELDRNSGNPPTDYEYYKSALDLEALTGSKYMPRGMWEEIGEVMGMDRSYMTLHLNLLQMPADVQHLADSNNVPEKVLREILKLSPAQWEKAVRLTISEELSASDIKKLKEGDSPKKTKSVTRAVKAARRMKAFWKESKAIGSDSEIGKVATEFAVGQDKGELEKAITKLEKFISQLKLRVESMD